MRVRRNCFGRSFNCARVDPASFRYFQPPQAITSLIRYMLLHPLYEAMMMLVRRTEGSNELACWNALLVYPDRSL